MSWLYSQALVAAFSEENSWDGEPCAQLNVMPTRQPFWRNDKPMDVLTRSPFGVTWRALTEQRGAELLTWFLEDFLARTLAQQEEEPGLTAPAQDSGEKWHASLAKFDHDSCSWRTHQYSLLGDLEPYSETWPRWGLMRNGECWEQSMPAHLTDENESGLLPTPTRASAHKEVPNSQGGNVLINYARGNRQWPTPIARDSRTIKGGQGA